MSNSEFGFLSASVAAALFLGMVLFLELGRRYGLHQAAKLGDASRSGVGVVDSSIYWLLTLLLGFTFSSAISRFDHRRELIVQEVSAVSTAWQRIASLPDSMQPPIRAEMRRYVDAVIASYDAEAASAAAEKHRQVSIDAQDRLWAISVAACITAPGEKARMLLLPALNEMFDVVDHEQLARRIHPPFLIYIMLAVAALASSLFAGYNMSSSPRRSWMHIIGVSATVAVVTFVVLEIETPRLGLVRIDNIDRALVELRATMN